MSTKGIPRQNYPDHLVAKIKGAAQGGISHKLLASLSGISESAIGAYATEVNRREVPADPSIIEKLREWLHCSN